MRHLARFDERFKKVEFKYTAADDKALRPLLDHKTTQQRTVTFWDTRGLTLWHKQIVLRERTTDDEADSTVKLRPVAKPADVGAVWRDVVTFEIDVVGKKPVGSAKLEFEPAGTALFSADQRSFVATCAGAPFETFALRPFGPVPARKRELTDYKGFPFELCVEAWTLKDGEFIELSCKVKRADAQRAKDEFKRLLDKLDLDPAAKQVSKTERVLTQFGARLKAA